MASKNLCIDLDTRTDSHGNKFFIGKLQFDGTINFKDGITMLVFVSDEGGEQIQICSFDKNDKRNNY